MVALKAHPEAQPSGSLPPALAAFLEAYVECKCGILATARKLQIPLEAALTLFADPALQANLALLDESEKREARQTAIATIHHAMTGLRQAMEYRGDPAGQARASAHLYRASIWLVRIAEGKVTPDRLPRRFQPNMQPDREEWRCAPRPSQEPSAPISALHAHPSTRHVSVGSEPSELSPAPDACAQPDREEGRCAPLPSQEPSAPIGALHARPRTRHVSVGSELAASATSIALSSAAERRQYVAPGPGNAAPRPRAPSPASLLNRAGAADSS